MVRVLYIDFIPNSKLESIRVTLGYSTSTSTISVNTISTLELDLLVLRI